MTIFQIFYIAMMVAAGVTCLSCRTIERNVARADSTRVEVHQQRTATERSESLSELLQQSRENLRIIVGRIHIEKDSLGGSTIDSEVVAVESVNESQSSSGERFNRTAEQMAVADSAHTATLIEEDDVHKHPPNYNKIYILVLLLVFYIGFFKLGSMFDS